MLVSEIHVSRVLFSRINPAVSDGDSTKREVGKMRGVEKRIGWRIEEAVSAWFRDSWSRKGSRVRLAKVRNVLSSVGLSSKVGLRAKREGRDESQLRIGHPECSM